MARLGVRSGSVPFTRSGEDAADEPLSERARTGANIAGSCRAEGRGFESHHPLRLRARIEMKTESPGRAARARCRVLSRADSAAIGAPCVLASHPIITPGRRASFRIEL